MLTKLSISLVSLGTMLALTAGPAATASATTAQDSFDGPPFTTPRVVTAPVNGAPFITPRVVTPPVNGAPFITPRVVTAPVDGPPFTPPSSIGPPVETSDVEAPIRFEKDDGEIHIEIWHPRSLELDLTSPFLSVHVSTGSGEAPEIVGPARPTPSAGPGDLGMEPLGGDLVTALAETGQLYDEPADVGSVILGPTSLLLVPEPSTALLLGFGLLMLAAPRRH